MGKWNQSNLFPTIEKWYRINSFPYCWSNIHFWMVWPSFHLYIGMILICREKLCLGKIPYSSLKAHFHSHARQKFPHSWLSSCGKKKFHHARLRRLWWNFFFTTPAEPFMGKFLTCMGMKMSLLWLKGNFIFPICGFAAHWENYNP